MFMLSEKTPFSRLLLSSAKHWLRAFHASFIYLLLLVSVGAGYAFLNRSMPEGLLPLAMAVLLIITQGVILSFIIQSIHCSLCKNENDNGALFPAMKKRIVPIFVTLVLCVFLIFLVLLLMAQFPRIGALFQTAFGSQGLFISVLLVGGFVCVILYMFVFWLPVVVCGHTHSIHSMMVSSVLATCSHWRQVVVCFFLLLLTYGLANVHWGSASVLYSHYLRWIYMFSIYSTVGVYTLTLMLYVIDNARYSNANVLLSDCLSPSSKS